jgi:hypothetical protein
MRNTDIEKLGFLQRTIKELLSSDNLMEEIKNLALDEDELNNYVAKLSLSELRTLFDSFENDTTPNNDIQKL